MTKKTICLIGCILIVSLVVAGCANNQPPEKATPGNGNNDIPSDGGTDSPTQQPTSAGTDVNDGPTASNITSVTQEELDQLMAGIQTLETDDIGGLSS